MISVLLSVYKNSKASEVLECLESIYNQTVKSDDIVIVFDGPIPPEVVKLVLSEQERHPEIKIVPLENNCGLGIACMFGLQKAKNEMVARMDTDDISVPDRFERQLKCFEQDPNLSIVGGNIAEFREEAQDFEGETVNAGKPAEGNKYVLVGRRALPETDAELTEYMKQRSPFNHQTIMFKKSEALNAGSYKDWFHAEDYYLFVRMKLNGAKFHNIQDDLVYMRVGKAMFSRRGGKRYFKSLRALYKFMRKNKMISFVQYHKNVLIRLVVHVLMSDKQRGKFYSKRLHPLEQKPVSPESAESADHSIDDI